MRQSATAHVLKLSLMVYFLFLTLFILLFNLFILFSSSDLQVFQSFPHMHQAGRKAWSTQWRDGQMIREVGRIEYFSYDHQQVEPVSIIIIEKQERYL